MTMWKLKPNLNELKINDDARGLLALEDYSTRSTDGKTEVVFRNLTERLIKEISSASYVVGSVAWLTSPEILRALAKTEGVSIIVQKEDFLRPDGEASKTSTRSLYKTLPGLCRLALRGLGESLSTHADPDAEPIRCVGNHNSEKTPAHPRAHNKFVVLCNDDGGSEFIRPFAVWTGSFNFTWTASRSFENAVIIRDEKIVEAYYQEYQQLLALSEPLDWETAWAAPEYRIGT